MSLAIMSKTQLLDMEQAIEDLLELIRLELMTR